MKTQKEFFRFLTRDLEEKILVERMVLERLGALISQAHQISDIYKGIRVEMSEFHRLLKQIRPIITSYKEFQAHLKEHKARKRCR
jgi:hypothetical protein